jgi:putative phosphoesterase
MHLDHLRPARLAPDQVQNCIGLIADTHMPQRCRALPAPLFDLFAGVDLILHAGDVGELWVLDRLGTLAPVVAVHGNDDSADAQRELPYQQVIAVAGLRILLWHSHYPDWEEEMASRVHSSLIPRRSVARAQAAGAQLAVFGHWHIPLTYAAGGVVVVNPGALAPGNAFSRQRVQTVALAFIDRGARPHIVHVDLAAPDRPYAATVDWTAPFARVLARYQSPIVTPELGAALVYLRPHLARHEIEALAPVVTELAHPVWDGQQPVMTLDEVMTAIDASDVDPALRQRLARLLHDWRAAQSNPYPGEPYA